MEKLGKLPARFVKDGVVTPGNASGITDGAAAVVLTTVKQAKSRRRFLDGTSGFGRASSASIRRSWESARHSRFRKRWSAAGIGWNDVAVMEINEAFAPQVIACLRELGKRWRES